MASHRPDAPAALLTAMIQVLLDADRLDDVRDAIAHGARMISPWDALTLREVGLSRALEVTLRRGEPLDSTAKAVERHLAQEAIGSGRTVSTLDRFSSEQTRVSPRRTCGATGCVSRGRSRRTASRWA